MTQHIARLVELLNDDHGGVRCLVAAALSNLAKELWKALPALLRMLKDDDPAVQTAAHETLQALAPWGGGRAGVAPGHCHGGDAGVPAPNPFCLAER
jgi:hypothetical protein